VALGLGNAHESPILYELVQQFVATVGRGVMEWLILDRGLIDRKAIRHCKTQLGVDVLIPIRRDMDLWTDAWALTLNATAWDRQNRNVARTAFGRR